MRCTEESAQWCRSIVVCSRMHDGNSWVVPAMLGS
jgi:hypothetical protein